jgi:hypothetical protein
MASIERQFGFYPYQLDIDTGQVKIMTLPALEETVKRVEASTQVAKDWYYSPDRTENGMPMPYPRRIFQLPKTHLLQVSNPASSDPELHIKFYVWCLSFFVGMRLTTEEAGFLDTTPIKTGALVDFNCIPSAEILSIIDNLWINYAGTEVPNLFNSAIHALFLSQNPLNLEFERFQYLYLASDACFKIASAVNIVPKGTTHAMRVEWMCQTYSLICPGWAKTTKLSKGKYQSDMADIRNNLFHEALWNQEPLGFSTKKTYKGGNLNLEFSALLCRLLVALMGCQTVTYVKSHTNTRSRYKLDLI